MMSYIDLAIQETANRAFIEPATAQDTDALGIAVSNHFKWNGQKIFETMQSAFEDANFHSFNKKLEALWKEEFKKS